MALKILNRRVVAEKSVAHFCQIVCSSVGGLVLVFGILKIAVLDLDEVQMFSALTDTLSLTGIFIILGFLCRAWRRSASG